MKYVILASTILLIIAGCAPTDTPPNDRIYTNYEVGNYKIFEATKQTFELGRLIQKQTYQQQEIVKSIKYEGSVEVIEQDVLTRPDSTKDWQLVQRKILRYYPDKLIAETNEGVFQYLRFPVTVNQEWSWNLTTNLQNNNILQYKSIHSVFSIKNTSYENCLIIEGNNIESAISLYKHQDVYAPQIGLIFRENTNINYCQATPDCIGKKIIDFGYSETYSLIAVGKK